jgi:hypothetical protein
MWLRRRLINLIFADQAGKPAGMVIFRRELPRTRGAGSDLHPTA